MHVHFYNFWKIMKKVYIIKRSILNGLKVTLSHIPDSLPTEILSLHFFFLIKRRKRKFYLKYKTHNYLLSNFSMTFVYKHVLKNSKCISKGV